MNLIHQPAWARNVLPLVRSIVGEIRERRVAVRQLESAATVEGLEQQRLLCGECAIHRAELRRAKRELERLGCVLLSLDPPAVAISSLDHALQGCVIWQP